MANALTTHTPLIKEVEVHSLMKGVECLKPLVLQCFFSRTSLIKGVHLHPLIKGEWVVRASNLSVQGRHAKI